MKSPRRAITLILLAAALVACAAPSVPAPTAAPALPAVLPTAGPAATRPTAAPPGPTAGPAIDQTSAPAAAAQRDSLFDPRRISYAHGFNGPEI
ncbi:MAG: hypothetical protein HGA45_26485, partial [Chloroflexales bacterium]|nr:hypothetical protein [Chloroflexales bacterium]